MMLRKAETSDPQPGHAPSATAAPADRVPQRRRAWLLAVLAAVLLVGGLAAIKTIQVMAAIAYGKSFPEPSEAVIEAVSERRLIAPTATAIGELQAKNVVELRIENAGVIRAIRFRSGDEVAAGDLLVQIDIAEEQADLVAARVEARRADLESDRQTELESRGVGTVSRRQVAEAEAAAARARVAALETAIDRKSIRAPFAGRVGITDLKPGQYVSEGELVTQLVGLEDEMYVDFALPQAAALAFDADAPIRVAIGEATANARVVAREPAIDPASRSLGFRAVMSSAGLDFPAGSLVTVTAPVGKAREQVVVPRTALVRSPYGDTIFVIDEREGESRARAVLVEVGEIVGAGWIVIRSGLEPGVRIAADGVFKLRHGALVDPQTPREPDRTADKPAVERAAP